MDAQAHDHIYLFCNNHQLCRRVGVFKYPADNHWQTCRLYTGYRVFKNQNDYFSVSSIIKMFSVSGLIFYLDDNQVI